MPNSGFQGQINKCFEGVSKQDIFPLNPRHANQNLPNPAFWDIFVRNMPARKTAQRIPGAFSRHLPSPRMRGHPTGTAHLKTPQNAPPSRHSDQDSPQSNPFPNLLRGGIIANSVAPFSTLSKPTCGYFFSRLTDQKKRRTGIPPADLVRWRYYVK